MEPVGIFAAIRLTEPAYQRFCADHGRALVDDVRYIQANVEAERAHYEAIESFRQAHGGEPTMTQIRAFMASHRKAEVLTPQGHYHHPGNRLIVRYEADSQTLFYLYILELRHPDYMAQEPSFLALQHIAQYKDLPATDHVLFSSSMPNMPTDPIWRSFAVRPGQWRELAGNEQPPAAAVQNLWELTHRHCFSVAQEMGETPGYPRQFLSAPLWDLVEEAPQL